MPPESVAFTEEPTAAHRSLFETAALEKGCLMGISRLDRLHLRPASGFVSIGEVNETSEGEQRRKLAHVVAIAGEVWGGQHQAGRAAVGFCPKGPACRAPFPLHAPRLRDNLAASLRTIGRKAKTATASSQKGQMAPAAEAPVNKEQRHETP